MKLAETPTDLKRARFEHIDHRWKQLYELQKECGLTALQYLFLTNSGGAATTLAFIGAKGGTNIGAGPKATLGLFVAGIILSGISRAKQFHHIDRLFNNWKALVADYFANRKTWDEISEADEKLAVENRLDYVIPYLSFGCFVLGAAIGCFAIMKI